MTLKGATGETDLAAAAKQLHECVALNPDHVPSKLQLGIAYSRLGELNLAESLLRTVLEQQPFDAATLYHLGGVLGQQGNTAQAAKVLSEHNRASTLQERRKLLDSQLFLNPLEPTEQLELGRVYAQLGNFAQAARERSDPAERPVFSTVSLATT